MARQTAQYVTNPQIHELNIYLLLYATEVLFIITQHYCDSE